MVLVRNGIGIDIPGTMVWAMTYTYVVGTTSILERTNHQPRTHVQTRESRSFFLRQAYEEVEISA